MSQTLTAERSYKLAKARFFTASSLLLFAFIGLIVFTSKPHAYWFYTQLMAVIDALVCLWLFWYLHHRQAIQTMGTIWHQILHWAGTLMLIYLTSYFINTGIMASRQAGLTTMSLLALSLYLSGVYADPIFMVVGITLCIFALSAALIQSQLILLMTPITLCALLVCYAVAKRIKE